MTLSASVLGNDGSEELVWTQLFGRLLYHETRNEWANNFLQRIEQTAPRPWLRPQIGCFAPAGDALKYVINCGQDLIPQQQVGDTLIVCCVTDDSIFVKEYDVVDRIEKSCKKLNLAKELEKNFYLLRRAISRNGNTIEVPLRKGKIAVFENDCSKSQNKSTSCVGTNAATLQKSEIEMSQSESRFKLGKVKNRILPRDQKQKQESQERKRLVWDS